MLAAARIARAIPDARYCAPIVACRPEHAPEHPRAGVDNALRSRNGRVEHGPVIDAAPAAVVRHAHLHVALTRAASAVRAREQNGVDAAVPVAGSFRPEEGTRGADADRI